MNNYKELTPDEMYLNRFHFNKSVSALREYYNILGTNMWIELYKLTPEERLELYNVILDTDILNNKIVLKFIQNRINSILNILVN